MYFDARAAKLLKSGEHLNVDGCPGLRLVATATRKSWIYRYKSADGRMKQVALGGQWPALAPHEAATRWEEQRKLRDAGQDPSAQRREAKRQVAAAKIPTSANYSVTQLVSDYVTGPLAQSRKEAGALAARRALERVLEEEPEFASKPVGEVRRSDCYGILDDRKSTPTASAKLRSLFGAAWEQAIDSGKVADDTPNWWRQVMRGKLKSRGKLVGGKRVGRQKRTLRDEEIAQLLAWLPNMHSNGADAVVMYLWTVTRGAEIFGMRPEHVTREKDGWWWTCPKALTKNERHEAAVDLRVPLVGRPLKVVQRRLKRVSESGFLFEDERGEQYVQHHFSGYIYDLQSYSAKRKRHGSDGLHLRHLPVTHWSPLRRTGRTLLASIGCPEEIAEAILGHMPEGVVGTYNAYTYDRERRLWLGKLASHLEVLAKAAEHC